MVNTLSQIVPYNIFFKERQSQTRSRALSGTNGLTGFVACLVLFYKAAVFCHQTSFIISSSIPWWILAMTI